jgi:hypothetical protein
MPSPLTGGCLCGTVRYSIGAPIAELRSCHCRDCQRASGAGGTVGAAVPKSAFKVTQGTPKRFSKTADSGRLLHRFYCGDCGSPLWSERAATPEMVILRAGTLDDSSGLKITLNIWTKSARSWDYIDPTSKQHPAQPDAPTASSPPGRTP